MINRPMTRRTVTGFVAGMTVAAALGIGLPPEDLRQCHTIGVAPSA